MKLTPCASAKSSCACASSSLFCSPHVIVPRQISETLRSVPGNVRYFIAFLVDGGSDPCDDDLAGPAPARCDPRSPAPRYTCAVSNRITSLASQVLRSSPLRHRAFRQFYIGSVGAALGYTIQTTIVAWLMATLTPSALMVALVQSASTAPSLLLGLFAGALADLVDRRRVILITQIVLFAATATLGVITLLGATTPATLLAFTFLIGACFTFYLPAQSASINDLVARVDVPRAVALGAVAFNVARAVGPALAGASVAWLSSGSALVALRALLRRDDRRDARLEEPARARRGRCRRR